MPVTIPTKVGQKMKAQGISKITQYMRKHAWPDITGGQEQYGGPLMIRYQNGDKYQELILQFHPSDSMFTVTKIESGFLKDLKQQRTKRR